MHVQPITLVPISGCRISSSEASRRTLKRRTDDISRVRNIASGGESSAQLKAEIRSLTTEQREELLQRAQLPVVIPTDHALAVKADLALPWNKLRVIRRYYTFPHGRLNKKINVHKYFRWLKGFNVSLASEAKQRQMADNCGR